jgi:hypothetical protein
VNFSQSLTHQVAKLYSGKVDISFFLIQKMIAIIKELFVIFILVSWFRTVNAQPVSTACVPGQACPDLIVSEPLLALGIVLDTVDFSPESCNVVERLL